MPDRSEVDKLLSQVVFLARNNSFEGLNALRHAVERDPDGGASAYVRERLWDFEGKVRGGIAFVLAGNYRVRGDLAAIREIYAAGDTDVRQSVLNALWGEPNASPEMGPGIVALAIEGARSPDAKPVA